MVADLRKSELSVVVVLLLLGGVLWLVRRRRISLRAHAATTNGAHAARCSETSEDGEGQPQCESGRLRDEVRAGRPGGGDRTFVARARRPSRFRGRAAEMQVTPKRRRLWHAGDQRTSRNLVYRTPDTRACCWILRQAIRAKSFDGAVSSFMSAYVVSSGMQTLPKLTLLRVT